MDDAVSVEFESMDKLEGNIARCMYILQSVAGLTFNEADVYLHGCVLGWDLIATGRSRRAIYSLKRKAQKKIDACEAPVLEMIKPYTQDMPLILIS